MACSKFEQERVREMYDVSLLSYICIPLVFADSIHWYYYYYYYYHNYSHFF